MEMEEEEEEEEEMMEGKRGTDRPAIQSLSAQCSQQMQSVTTRKPITALAVTSCHTTNRHIQSLSLTMSHSVTFSS